MPKKKIRFKAILCVLIQLNNRLKIVKQNATELLKSTKITIKNNLLMLDKLFL